MRSPRLWPIIGLLLVACGGAPGAPVGLAPSAPPVVGTLTVFAAASLTEAFKEIGAAIETAHPGTAVTFNFAGSPVLRAQLREGARADVVAVADEPTMTGARQEGTIATDPRLFAQNRLVVIVPAQNRAGVVRLHDLARPGLKLVLAQREVPAGTYARQALAKLSQDPAYGGDFGRRVLANVVSEESNVRQVVTKVQLGEVDAGVVYASDITLTVRADLTVIAIPDQHNVFASYPIAVVTGTRNSDGATAFIDYVLSPPGQAILSKHGFLPVGSTSGAARLDQRAAHPLAGRSP